MTIDYPSRAQIPALRSLWEEAFGDTELFLDAFFETAFSTCRSRCVTENGEVTAALYWFEMTCDGMKIAYLYAVATAAAHRGRGLFSALFQDAKAVLAEQGFDGILLVPETPELGKMYEKFGFSPCTAVRELSEMAGDIAANVREIGPGEFACLRRNMLPAGSVLQEGADLQFLGTQSYFWAGEGWLAVGQIYEGKLICTEFLGDEGTIPGILRALGVPQGRFRLPGNERPFGYFLPLHGRCGWPAYFGLALD